MTSKKTLKKWFSNFMKPVQEHFYALIDSFWHKDEKIPMDSIEGLERIIEGTASAKQLLNHLGDTNAHRNLFDKKVDKEEGKGLSANDFTNDHKQKLEGLQPTDVSSLLPKGDYEGTGQQLKEAIDGLQTKMQQVETTLSVDDTAFDTLQEIVAQVKSNKNLKEVLSGKIDNKDSFWSSLKKAIYFYNVPNKTNEGIHIDGESVEISAESLVNIRNRGSVNITGALGQRGEALNVSEKSVDINSEKYTLRTENIQQSSEVYSHSGKKMSIDAEEVSIRANRLLVNGEDLSTKLNSLGDFNVDEINRRIEAIENTLMNAGFIIQQP